MNFKTTILLVVLLAILGAAWFFTRDTPGREEIERQRAESTGASGQPVFAADDLPTESVARLVIQRGDARIVVERDGENWRQAEPVFFPISQWQGQALIDKAATLRYSDRFKPGSGGNPTLAEVGLDSPAAVVTLEVPAKDDKPARTHSVKFGRAIGGTAYVQVNDSPEVYAVSADAHKLLATGKVEDWRSRSITAPSEGTTQRLTLRREDATIDLNKVDGRWMLDADRGDRADADAVKGLLSGIGSLYISEFIADAPADLGMYGLSKPRLTIQAQTSDKPLTIHIGGPVDLKRESFFAMWTQGEVTAPVVFSLSKTGVERFEKPVDDLRDKRITLARASDVNELTIQRDGQEKIHVVKKPEGWSFADPPPPYGVDSQAVRDLLDAIVEARATGFVAQVSSDDDAAATIVLNLVGGKAPERLTVRPHKTSDDKPAWLVVRDGEKTGLVITRDRLEPAFRPVVSLRHREVLALQRDQVASIRIQRDDGEYVLSRKRLEGDLPGAGPWTLEGHDRLEDAAATALLDAVATLRAEMWLAPEPIEAGLTVTVMPFEGDAVTLKIDPRSRLASGPWSEGVIVVPQTLVDAATAELRYRTVMPLQVENIRKLTLTRGQQSVTVERSAAGKFSREDGQTLNEADAGATFDTLAGLRAERFRDAGKVKLSLAQPTTTLTMELADGGTRTLGLWPPTENDLREHLGRVNDSPLLITLNPDSVERLVKLLDGGDTPAPAHDHDH